MDGIVLLDLLSGGPPWVDWDPRCPGLCRDLVACTAILLSLDLMHCLLTRLNLEHVSPSTASTPVK